MDPEFSEVALGTPDYVVMALYLAGLIGLGLYYRKFANKSLENYFLGGRQFKGWITGTSYAVTCMNAGVPLVYCGMAVVTGTWICWFYISRFGLALMIGAVLFAVFWRRLGIFTSPEFYELRFSGTPAITMRTWVALRSAMIAVVAWTGTGLLGLSKVSEALLGWNQTETFLIVVPVILVYVVLSGYVGVVVSDVFQTAILIVSSLVLMGMVWNDFGGPAGLYAALAEIDPAIVRWHPPTSHEFLGVMGILAWTLGTAVGYGGDTAPMSGAMEGQRLLSCRDSREASKMYVWTAIILFVMLAVLTLPALGAIAKWPGLYTGEIADPELAYPMLLRYYLPPGLLGLALTALFASIMSTIDSNMNLGAQVFINDVYRRSIRPKASVRHYMLVGKIVMLTIMGLGIVVAVKANKLIDISVFMLGLSSAELTANWGQWWWWRFNGPARLAASFGGPTIFLVMRYMVYPTFILPYYLRPENMPLWLAETADRLPPEVVARKIGNSYVYIPILVSMGLTCLVWIIVALVTKPDPDEKLIEFYRRARPMGWWGPIAQQVQGTQPSSRPIFFGLGIALLGATAIASGVISFSCVYVARWWVAAIAAAVTIVSGVWFARAYGGYIDRLLADEPPNVILPPNHRPGE
jgi:SSS family solute:Na+ symporter